MKVGDLVTFTNRSHSLYPRYSQGPGLVVEVDRLAQYQRGSRQEYLGAKVTVHFPGLSTPAVVTEHSLKKL
jgi:hypothetical protein